MKKRVMITGASGLLGRVLMKEFNSTGGWEVQGLAFSRAKEGLVKVDISDKEAVFNAVNKFKPHMIVHSAVDRRVDIMEKNPENAKRVNLDGTQYVCDAAVSVNAWLLFISTDYVFDGTNPPYKITDEPNPLNLYGKMKLEGEKITFNANADFGVLRVPIFYDEVETLEECPVTVLFSKVKDTSKKVAVDDHARRYPTYCGDIAYVVRELSERRLKDSSIKGIYHWSNNENMSKYEMAVAMAKAHHLSADHIERDPTPPVGANRPYHNYLDCSSVLELGISKYTKFENSIGRVLEPHL